jgi:hypothetical protein
MAWLYILQSQSTSRYYVGSTNDLDLRSGNTIAPILWQRAGVEPTRASAASCQSVSS